MPDAVQLALAGRSNVGKSSLINALARRRQLAKISAHAGQDAFGQSVPALPDGFYLTDLPGYGYAVGARGTSSLGDVDRNLPA